MFANVISTGTVEAGVLASCSRGGLPTNGGCYSGYGPAPGYFCKLGATKVST
jgi:hypothetical protein